MDDLNARGVEHFNAGRFEEALSCFRAAVAAGESVAQARVFIGHVAGSLGRPDEAAAEFVSVIRDFPRHLPAYAGLANVVLRRAPARDPAAEKALLKVLSLKTGGTALAETLRACGQALGAVGELAAAEKALTKALVLGGGAARRRLRDVLRARAESFLAAGALKKAEGELRKLLALAPEDERARRALVRLLRRRGLEYVQAGRLDNAERILRRAVSLAPADPLSRRRRAEVARMREKSKRARRSAARRRKADKVRVLRGRGGALVAAGRLVLAEKALRRALLVGPGDAGAGRQLAEVLRMREQAEEARRQAARAAKGEKLRALLEALKAASQAYRSSSRTKTAAKILAKILRLEPGDARARLIAGGILFSSGAVARGRALLAEGLRLNRGVLLPGEVFAALMKLGRYKEALAAGERLLDGRPGLADIRALRDPWEWDDRPLAERRREVLRLERAAGPAARRSWVPYYRADLRGPEELRQFSRLAALPGRRYGWMLCRGRTGEAFAELDRALPEAPPDEAGQVLAWRGAFDLWLGRYESAVGRFDEALRLGAPYALSWRAGALLKLGRAEEALRQLDEALTLYPRDLEAYVWRGEAKRALGRHREALKDLNEPTLSDPDRATPIWLWALFNRALAKAALGDSAGLKADFDAIPVRIRDHIRGKSGREDMVGLLEAGLELSRGFRREEYRQAIWMA
ncbi:MAG: tetratricopeptide repeat protein [Elusimicrobia bacterium]|nr:tetratricopeptide repeat protein [Elusimicrobiota bacterium]